MSVRDAAGRHPRFGRIGSSSVDPQTGVPRAPRHRPQQARPIGSATPRAEALTDWPSTAPPAADRRAGPGRTSERDPAQRPSRPIDTAADRAEARPGVGPRRGVGPRLAAGPLIACLVTLGLAALEATSALTGGAARFAAGPGSASGPLTAADPVRTGGGAGVTDPTQPAGAAPRRVPSSGPEFPVEGTAITASVPSDLPACSNVSRPAPDASLGQWATTIVDTSFALPGGYHPADLVPVGVSGIGGWGMVRAVVIDDLRALSEAAARAGNPIAVQSAYRSRERQAEVYAGWLASSGEPDARRFSAQPGHSEHQLGTALDLRAAAGDAPWSGAFGSTAAGHWLAKHAAEFGFVLSYPAGAAELTCYGAEAWHVRYVGREIAAQVQASGLPLRAWLWAHRAGG